MRYKKTLILTIILFVLFVIGAVSATENVTESIVNVDARADVSVSNVVENTDDVVNVEYMSNEVVNPNENLKLNCISVYEDNDSDSDNKNNIDDSLLSYSNNSKLSAGIYSFTDLKNAIMNSNGEFYMEHSYSYHSELDASGFLYGITINSPLTIYGNGHTIDGKSLARIFHITGDLVELYDINFRCGAGGQGGAIYWEGDNGKVSRCNFYSNKLTNTLGYHGSTNLGGAIYWSGYKGVVDSCTFTKNLAKSGGAIYWAGNYGNIYNSDFTSNKASENGGAIYISGNNLKIGVSNTKNSIVEKNSATNGGAIYIKGHNNTVYRYKFDSNSATNGGAIYISGNDNLLKRYTIYLYNGNVASENGGAIYCSGDNNVINIRAQDNSAKKGGVVYWDTMTSGNVILEQYSKNTAKLGENIFLNKGNLTVSNISLVYRYNASFTDLDIDLNNVQYFDTLVLGRNYYFSSSTDKNLKEGINLTKTTSIDGNNYVIDGKNIGSVFTANKINLKITLKNIKFKNCKPLIFYNCNVTIYNCTFENCSESEYGGTIVIINPTSGISYIKKCYFINTPSQIKIINKNDDLDKDNNSNNISNSSSNINELDLNKNNKIKTELSISNVDTVYNSGKYIIIKLTDENSKAVSSVKVTVVLGGKTFTPTTDQNGKAKVSTNGLVPKNHIAIITFDGNTKYDKSTTTAKVVVKKATVKLTAKAKTFNKSVKTKKYTVTLKTNQNKIMKSTKITLKVNGKTYSAKTNAKGQTTFKITKLTKKGKFNAVITYKGNAYYNKVTKNINIKCK